MVQIYSAFNICLIFFVALLAIVFPLSKSQTNNKIQCDEVSRALKKNKPIGYNAAKKCLKSFPFNAKHATETVDLTLHHLKNYYIFFDRAKEPTSSGLTYQPVDLEKELKSLRTKPFESDYDFTTVLRNLLFELKDGHTRITNLCYQNFVYDQNLNLYSVITKDNKQVFNDTLDPSNNDCEVIEIDGKPALQVIIDFADNNIAYSKDRGVRFNMALAPCANLFSQQFTLRVDLPETSSITYKLTCPKKNKKTPFKLERLWNITYNDGINLFQNFCLDQNNITTFSSDDHFAPNSKATNSKFTNSKVTNSKRSTSSNQVKASTSNNKLAHAKLVADNFYLLDDGNKVGVIVITEEKKYVEGMVIDGLNEFKKRGVKKIILDMSNNEGGLLTVSLFLPSLLLSPEQPNSFPTDIIINNFTIPKIKDNFKHKSFDDQDSYNPNFFLNFPDGDKFTSAEEFIGSLKNQRSNLYLNALTPNEKKLLNNTSFPWTSNDMIIITNGFCGSACALTTIFFSEVHNVKTIAVGGLLNTPMSYSTYPGGEVTSPEVIASDAGDNTPDLPGVNAFILAIRESYGFVKNGTNNNIVVKDILEYTFKPADHRIYYDENNAKDSSFLWLKASEILNNKA
ncbi:4882_t:CDS:2 [Cetraspora pellucida]|uniref:4882_t:CDS:1 n=1 Tax=Cetraspora pellucida TaxID=1433469 RepID=A0A9N9AMY7_9GLOM|nr:4882_t:CDS:2 [Cetraspora pellucida]